MKPSFPPAASGGRTGCTVPEDSASTPCRRRLRYAVKKLRLKNSPDPIPYSCGLKSKYVHRAGLLTSPVRRAFPVGGPVAKSATNRDAPFGAGSYSNRYCSGFAPDSLFTRRIGDPLSSSCTANVALYFRFAKRPAEIFSRPRSGASLRRPSGRLAAICNFRQLYTALP